MPDDRFELEALTEEQLRALNRAVVERLKSLHEARVAAEMRAFEPGDLVSFEHRGEDGHRTVRGIVLKTNRKTVTLLDERRMRWNVSPGLLEHAEPEAPAHGSHAASSVNPVPPAALPGPARPPSPAETRRLPRKPKKRKRR